VRSIVRGVDELLGAGGSLASAIADIEVDDGFVGPGYGEPSDGSVEAQQLAARTEAVFVDHTYTAKALAGLIAYLRAGRFTPEETVLFWHTGGQAVLFA
jgi:1-aminocyclopropane-1-carboxylate deaminase/D-cysteine desulfhydrase-like pyridoxal-dependent ACC family enzyme